MHESARVYGRFCISAPCVRELSQLCRGQWHEATGPLRKAKHENTQHSRDRRPGSGGGALQPGTQNKGGLPKAPPDRLRREARARRAKGESPKAGGRDQRSEVGSQRAEAAGGNPKPETRNPKVDLGRRRAEGRRRWVTSPGSCALGSRWRCWYPAAPARRPPQGGGGPPTKNQHG